MYPLRLLSAEGRMDPILEAHPVTVITVAAGVLWAPFYLLCTYVFSGASERKGAVMGGLFWPTGMTPLFLVPYALFFRVLSWLNRRMHGETLAPRRVFSIPETPMGRCETGSMRVSSHEPT